MFEKLKYTCAYYIILYNFSIVTYSVSSINAVGKTGYLHAKKQKSKLYPYLALDQNKKITQNGLKT